MNQQEGGILGKPENRARNIVLLLTWLSSVTACGIFGGVGIQIVRNEIDKQLNQSQLCPDGTLLTSDQVDNHFPPLKVVTPPFRKFTQSNNHTVGPVRLGAAVTAPMYSMSADMNQLQQGVWLSPTSALPGDFFLGVNGTFIHAGIDPDSGVEFCIDGQSVFERDTN